MTLTVTVVDDQTGETETGFVGDDDYMLICHGGTDVANLAVYPTTGTHVLTIKGVNPKKKADG